MSESAPELIKLKRKYAVGQTNGRYRGGHNMSAPAKKKKQGNPDPPNGAVMVLLPSGKTRMQRQEAS